jgi:hypothetical protein
VAPRLDQQRRQLFRRQPTAFGKLFAPFDGEAFEPAFDGNAAGLAE